MALNVQKGTISAPAGTGNQTLSLASNFDPKAIILWTNGATADGRTNANGRLSTGFGTYRSSTVAQCYESAFSTDAGASSACSRGNNTTACIKLFSATTPTTALEIRLVSMSTGATSNVILNFVTTLSGAVVHYMVLGGADITDASVGNYTTTAAVATQDVTVATGFGQPDLVFFMSNGYTAQGDNAGANKHAKSSFGCAKSATERWFGYFAETDSSATMVCAAVQRAKAVIATNTSGTTINSEADLSAKASWPPDGFQMAYSTQAAGTATFVYYLALKGTFSATVGNSTIPTAAAPQTQNLAIGAGTPNGAMIWGWPGPSQSGTTVDTTHADLGGFAIGGTDGTNEGYCGWTEDDGNGTAFTGLGNSSGKVYQRITADAASGTNPPILNSECNASISGANTVLTWGDTDPTALMAFGYVLLGSAVSGLTANVDDTTSLADARAFDVGSAAADTSAPADAQALGFGPSAADSSSPTDSATAERGRYATPADSTSLADGTAQEIGRSASPTDATSLADAQALGFGPSAADSTSPADARAFEFGPSAADSTSPADTQALGFGESAADTASPADGTAQEIGRSTSAADSVSPTDGTTQATGKGVSPADSVAPTDARTFGFGPGVNDSLAPGDSLVLAAGFAQAVSDATALADALTTAQGYALSTADATALSDALVLSVGRAVSLADSLTALDVVRFDIGAAVADAAALADAQAFGRGAGLAEVIVVTDANVSQIGLFLSELLTATDEVIAGAAAPYIHTLLPQNGAVTSPGLEGLVFLVVAAGIVTVIDASGIVASFEAPGSPTASLTGGIPTESATGGSGDAYGAEGAQV